MNSATFTVCLSLLFSLLLTASPLRAESGNRVQDAVRELGRVNGTALACGDQGQVREIKALMTHYPPKTPEISEIFFEATNTAFLAQSGSGAPCPSPEAVKKRTVWAAHNLKAVAPASPGGAAVGSANSSTGAPWRFDLVDHDGLAAPSIRFRGRFMLVFFGYTFCPDVCPVTLSVVSEALDLLGDKADRVTPVFISVDPARDTPEVLKDYVEAFRPGIVGMSGTGEQIRRAADSFKVTWKKVVYPDWGPNEYAMDHTASLFLIGPEGEFKAKFAYGITGEALAKRLRALVP